MSGLSDPVALVFYGCVCAALAGFIPASARIGLRLGIGALVGICSAAVLPAVRGLLGL